MADDPRPAPPPFSVETAAQLTVVTLRELHSVIQVAMAGKASTFISSASVPPAARSRSFSANSFQTLPMFDAVIQHQAAPFKNMWA